MSDRTRPEVANSTSGPDSVGSPEKGGVPQALVVRVGKSLSGWRSWPGWVQTLVVYGLARVATAVILLVVARTQEATAWTSAHPSYMSYVALPWDGSWYQEIYDYGYPEFLPTGADGVVRQNRWAFFPLFPMLVRFLDALTGWGWELWAPLLALLSGAAAMLVIHRLVTVAATRAVRKRPGLPLATVAVVSFFPTAVVMQVAYTESLALLLIALTLLLVFRRRYEWAMVTVLLLGLTRAVALPIAAVVLWHAIMRIRAGAVRSRDVLRLGALFVVSLASGLMWPAWCGWVTGDPDGYLRTQAAWRGADAMQPFLPWFGVARWLGGPVGPWILAAVLIATVVLILSPVARRLGPEMQAWSGAYLGYLAMAVPLSTSLYRFLLLAFPLGAVTIGWTRSRAWLWLVIVASIIGQCWWVWGLWRLTPPSGWPP